MKKTMLWSVLGSLAVGTIASGEGFEAPTYQDGQSIDKVGGWTVTGTATVTADQSAEGTQSLKIAASGTLSKLLAVPELRFIDLAVLPAYTEVGQPAETLNIGGAKLSFVESGSGGQIIVVSGTDTEGLSVGTSYSIEADNLGKDWVRVTVREDVKKGTWDLFLDGEPTVFDQILAKDNPSFRLENASGEAVYLDSYTESAENPLFKDSDGDGMPDAYEVANGLNPHIDDRESDLDVDGISNIREMFNGSSPGIAGSGRAFGSILYVDNKNGSDSNAGKSSYAIGGDGPKASIKAAMAAAQSEDMIVIMPGTGVYQEGSSRAEGKQLTIKALANITIK